MAQAFVKTGIGASDAVGREEAVVLCGGRHAAEVIDALLALGRPVHGCLDGKLPRGTEVYPGVVVVGSDTDLDALVADGFTKVYLGLGGLGNLPGRIELFRMLRERGVVQPTLVHPTAHIAPSASIGVGTTVLAGASVGPMSVIGCNGVITQGAVVTHHVAVGDHVVLAPQSVLAAGVRVGDEATIGMGVTVYHDVSIGKRSVIVNGIHVMQDVPGDSIVKHRSVPAVSRREF